jgi:aspartate aminotransferase-like enzyme
MRHACTTKRVNVDSILSFFEDVWAWVTETVCKGVASVGEAALKVAEYTLDVAEYGSRKAANVAMQAQKQVIPNLFFEVV